MKNHEELIGKHFGRLTVLSIDKENPSKNIHYICKCECGNIISVQKANLKGHTKSCGCLRKEVLTKHGLSQHRIGGVYKNMISRCTNPNNHAYKHYGERGIKVCEEWLNDINSFYDWALKNGYKDNLTLDRIDNDGDYTPENCRWADYLTQANNTRRNKHVLYKGNKYTVSELARELKVSRETICRNFIAY